MANIHTYIPETSTNVIDFNSPMYVQSSDIPGIPLVTTLFSGNGYSGWRRNMLRAISGRNKIGFLDGSCPRPSDDSPNLRQWERVNDIVTSWILNSMTKEISDSVVYADNAQEVWAELEERYGTVNGVRIFELKKELATISQGSLDIAAYFNKIKTLWDELGLINRNHSINCTCGAKKQFHKFEEDQKLYQFLMGLNETYVTVRSHILMISPLPSVGTAYNMLVSDEKQRQMQPAFSHVTDSASFIASNARYPQSNNARPPQNNNSYNHNQQRSNNNRGTYNQRNNSQRNDKRGNNSRKPYYCQYCNTAGHTLEYCYKRKQSEQSQAYSRNNKSVANATSQLHDSGQSIAPLTSDQFQYSDTPGYSPPCNLGQGQSESASYSLPGLTKAQYSHLVNLLQQANIAESPPEHIGSANFAGPFNEEAIGSW